MAQLIDAAELEQKAAARAAERERELVSQLTGLKQKVAVSGDAAELQERLRALTKDAMLAEERQAKHAKGLEERLAAAAEELAAAQARVAALEEQLANGPPVESAEERAAREAREAEQLVR